MADDTASDGAIQTGARMLSLIEVLNEEGGAGVTTVADRLGIAKSTAHAHLQTLHERRYLVKRDGEYRVGLRFLVLVPGAPRGLTEVEKAQSHAVLAVAFDQVPPLV